MHERLFHGNEMSKSARNVSNILYAEARKHPANLLLHMILNDDEFERVAQGWDSISDLLITNCGSLLSLVLINHES